MLSAISICINTGKRCNPSEIALDITDSMSAFDIMSFLYSLLLTNHFMGFVTN
jgi:hypothetical protein